MAEIKPWNDAEKVFHQRTARQCLLKHDHPSTDWSTLTRANCGACALSAKHGGSPNYAGWARIYVEASEPMPERWRDSFERERQSDNRAYSSALERSIATFGVTFR